MRHPAEGVLRRLVDEPAGVADTDRAHVADCPDCLTRLAAVRADAERIGAALAVDTADLDTEAALRRLPTATSTTVSLPRRSRSPLRRPVVAAVAVAVVLAGAGTAAANDWLRIFRTEQVAAVTFSPADVLALPDLSAYGSLDITQDGDPHEVRDAAAASTVTGLSVPTLAALPRGVSGEPVHRVTGKVAAVFTFSAEATARAAGPGAPALPPGLDGAQVRLEVGPAAAAVWSQPSGMPVLMVGRAKAPAAYSSGVPFTTVRDYLLSLPGLPADLAARLRSFTETGSTLPLPVPGQYVTTSSATVRGLPATVLATRDGAMAVVLWVERDVITAVAGAFDADEVVGIAEGLR